MNVSVTFANLMKEIDAMKAEMNQQKEKFERQHKEDAEIISKLTVDIEKLRKEREISVKSDRRLLDHIDRQKFEYIFMNKVNKRTGKITKCTRTEAEGMWSRFYRNFSLPIFLKVGTSTGHTADYKFVYPSMSDMPENEFLIFVETVKKAVDIIYDAKKNLEELKNV